MITIRHDEQTRPIRRELLVAKPISAEPVFISDRVNAAVERVMSKHFVTRAQLFSTRRDDPIVTARRSLMKIMYHDFSWSPSRIASYLRKDISTVQYHLGLKAKSKVKRGPFKD